MVCHKFTLQNIPDCLDYDGDEIKCNNQTDCLYEKSKDKCKVSAYHTVIIIALKCDNKIKIHVYDDSECQY